MLKLVKAHELVYVLSIPYPKLAIMCLYFRIFRSQLVKALLYLTGLVVLATCLFGVIAAFANCRPFSAFWNPGAPRHCTMDTMTAFRYYSIPNIVTDVVMLIVPIPTLWRLQMDLLVKIGIFVTFLLSAIGIVGAILRFVSFLQVNIFDDITYLVISPGYWTIIEPGLYLVAATVPTLRPLVRRIIKAANQYGPITRAVKQCYQDTCSTTNPNSSDVELAPRQLSKKGSIKQLETVGRRPSRSVQLDDYHRVQSNAPLSPRSMDEDSMVCADAVIAETMSRQGRNPDGTLVSWSLQPVHVSPFRTSFVMRDKSRADGRLDRK
ncbi:hypothetical protein BDV96DRAFT_406243 [Lophiotrema nucula]|uniref:Rhodopsin domain-containing protein n=1 Tax=Lophiotrema nucula TaxID=690887 RepID=A0A6A5ZHP2_9PLEO|nr:hypothetical protein BDV96DRAFT_406243 [Lophiotrema nucula]